MKSRVETTLNLIAERLKGHRSEDSTLMGEQGGIILFHVLYSKYYNVSSPDDDFQNLVQTFAEKSVEDIHPGFAIGRAGISWLFNFLYYNELISIEDKDLLCDEDPFLEKWALANLKRGNADFLHGPVGIAYYLLYSNTFSARFFDDFFDDIERLMSSSEQQMVPYYNSDTSSVESKKVNLSLSHGITAILKLCLQCHRQNVCPDQAKQLAFKIIAFLKGHTNRPDQNETYFSNIVEKDQASDYHTRLGWCYGDLSTAYLLYQAGLQFSDRETTTFALQVLENCAGRRDPAITLVADCALCHGAAGIAHVFNKMWNLTRSPIFKEATDFWILYILNHFQNLDWSLGYQRINYEKGRYESDEGFLIGIAGIGLAMLSYIRNDFDWDYIMMLN
jgi:lantibiotic modifying enzyme